MLVTYVIHNVDLYNVDHDMLYSWFDTNTYTTPTQYHTIVKSVDLVEYMNMSVLHLSLNQSIKYIYTNLFFVSDEYIIIIIR